jgi:hypothetical protein
MIDLEPRFPISVRKKLFSKSLVALRCTLVWNDGPLGEKSEPFQHTSIALAKSLFPPS